MSIHPKTYYDPLPIPDRRHDWRAIAEDYEPGDPIGYGPEYRCPEDMLVGVAALGYGDGYPRRMPAGTPVLVNGRPAPLAGRVSMDMLTIDLRGHPEAKPGDPVVLWGPDLPADEIAARAGTISYELFCHVAKRIPRVEAGGAS